MTFKSKSYEKEPQSSKITPKNFEFEFTPMRFKFIKTGLIYMYIILNNIKNQ